MLRFAPSAFSLPAARTVGKALLVTAALALAACGDSDDITGATPEHADKQLRGTVATLGLDGVPDVPAEVALTAVRPQDDGLVKLGQLLFFSKTLGGTFDVACASCHHPGLAGGDALSLGVGVAAVHDDFLGPGREVDPTRDYDPQKDGGPNVPRNSQTILNVSLYQRAMFFDGRIFRYQDGSGLRTPDAPHGPDPQAGADLLEAQARFPVTSPDEMRNFFHPELEQNEEFRQLLIGRLRGTTDTERMADGSVAAWLGHFRTAFEQPAGTVEQLITYTNVQKAIAAYERSLVFVNSPWRRYLAGDGGAIGADAKRGALLFLLPAEQGGLGCGGCHSGDFFTDEKFYNTGFPQIGRGKRIDGRDFGRWQVSKDENDLYAFRVPSLVNVAVGAPFGHAGTFTTLEELLRYHANPRDAVDTFDFGLQQLGQFAGKTVPYPKAREFTEEALAAPNLAAGLPHRDLSDAEVRMLKAFLEALTDDCLLEDHCLDAWVPLAGEDPDGNLLVRSFSRTPPPPAPDDLPPADATPPTPYAPGIDLTALGVAARTAFADTVGCNTTPAARTNDGLHFVERASDLGLTLAHGFSKAAWFAVTSYNLEDVMMAGGVTAAYVTDDCWPDLIYATGNVAGTVVYASQAGTTFTQEDLLPGGLQLVTGTGVADLNGDFRREIVVGNLTPGEVEVLSQSETGQYESVAALPMVRNTFGMAFGDYNKDGFPEMYFGHWDTDGLPGTAPAFWKNDGGLRLLPSDGKVGTSAADNINQPWQFAPGFTDVNQDGHLDLLIASDFFTSTVLAGSDTKFTDVTDRSVVTDENGMGSAIGDFDNDLDLDWFVSSIHDALPEAEGGLGRTGNRLYRNDSVRGAGGELRFANVTAAAGVAEGGWGWGACFQDFNNDGWLDIFQVAGYGYIPYAGDAGDFQGDPADTALRDAFVNFVAFFRERMARFRTPQPFVFLNNTDGTFTESAAAWGLGEVRLDGRGIACFDYDRDGDVDIATVDHSRGLKFFENRSGPGPGRHFLALRLVGSAPNTEALGATVYVTADLDGDGVIETGEVQMRAVGANSNYLSQNTPDLHLGLGKAASVAELSVVWPDGTTSSFTDVAVDQFLIYTQP